MKLKSIKKAAIGFVAGMVCVSAIPFAAMNTGAAGQTYNLNGAGQHKGTGPDGYSYEIWAADTNQPSSMTLGDNGTFSTTWNCAGPSGNFLARRGIDMGSTKKFQEYNGITCDFDVTWSSSSSGNSRLCIYGWTRSPLVEYYIVEDWANWCPPNGQPGQGNVINQFSLDDSTYYIYKENRNSYTIDGNQPFVQYYSVRQKRRQSGTIHVSDHFEQWESAGLQMGVMYEVAFNVEGWESSGQADVKQNTITLGTGGGGGGQPVVTTPVEPDENGYYLKESFESGTGDWSGRGAAKVAASTGYDGSKGILVSGRTAEWNGASMSLSSNPFKAGETFAFGAAVMQDSESSTDLKLTLQYKDSSGTEKYSEIKTVTAPKGQWVDLSNSSYTIPEGASNLLIYIEVPESLTDFYVDGAYAAVKGTKPLISVSSEPVTQPPTDPPVNKGIRGDVNEDGVLDSLDLIGLRKGILAIMSGGGKAPANSDVNGDGDVSVADLVALKRFLLGIDKQFPDPVTTTTTTTTAKITTTTTTSTPSPGQNLNAAIRKDMPEQVPSGAEQSSQCKVEKKSYLCKYTGKQKSCNVILPPNYDPNKKYPVMYILHGIMGNEDDMKNGFGTQGLMTGLMKSGQAEEFIAVTPNMFTSKTMNGPSGINQQTCAEYDNFLYDISESLIPFIEENYPVKTGRENRAITGFSMGGREAIYIGLMRPDLFAYVGGACPAPGITPGADTWMQHPGCMQESEMKFRDVGPEPNVFMITGGTNDGTVGTFPKQYSDILTRNGVDHVYQSINGGGHGDNSVKPHLYTFFRYAFK